MSLSSLLFMRTAATAASVWLLLAIPGPPLFTQTSLSPKLRVAVLDLSEDAISTTTSYRPGSATTELEIPPPEDFALGLTELLTTALVESGRLVVLERSKIAQVTEEQDFGASGRVNQETAAAQGRSIGAQVLLTGAITEYSYTSSSLGGKLNVLRSVGVSGQLLEAMVALDVRVLDAVTGEVLQSERGEGRASARSVSGEVEIGDQQFSSAASAGTPLGQASRQAVRQIVAAVVEALSDVPWSGRVIDVRGDLIYINAGSDDGIEPGMEFDVFEQQEPLVDPATGRTLGAPERRVGSLRVTRVDREYAVAEAITGTSFERNHLIRSPGQGPRP